MKNRVVVMLIVGALFIMLMSGCTEQDPNNIITDDDEQEEEEVETEQTVYKLFVEHPVSEWYTDRGQLNDLGNNVVEFVNDDAPGSSDIYYSLRMNNGENISKYRWMNMKFEDVLPDQGEEFNVVITMKDDYGHTAPLTITVFAGYGEYTEGKNTKSYDMDYYFSNVNREKWTYMSINFPQDCEMTINNLRFTTEEGM